MKVLIIPDVHLKPFMFKQAAELMERGIAKRAVCLMDIPDDWDKQFDISLYEQTYDAAISFAKKYPDTAWCYGNHDLSYVWHKLETGYSPMAAYTVQKKLIDLKEVLPEGNLIKYVHRIDNVLFSHAGMSKDFVNLHVPKSKYDDVDDVLDYVNHLGEMKMWYDGSILFFANGEKRLLFRQNAMSEMWELRLFRKLLVLLLITKLIGQWLLQIATLRKVPEISPKEMK